MNIPREALNRGLQMKDRIVQQLFGQQAGGMQAPSMPLQNYQSLMQPAPMPTPQFQGYQGMNPMALAQMLRRGQGGAVPQAPSMGGVGLNPNARPFNVGLNPNAGRGFGINPNMIRSTYLDFINSMSNG